MPEWLLLIAWMGSVRTLIDVKMETRMPLLGRMDRTRLLASLASLPAPQILRARPLQRGNADMRVPRGLEQPRLLHAKLPGRPAASLGRVQPFGPAWGSSEGIHRQGWTWPRSGAAVQPHRDVIFLAWGQRRRLPGHAHPLEYLQLQLHSSSREVFKQQRTRRRYLSVSHRAQGNSYSLSYSCSLFFPFNAHLSLFQ